MLLCLENIRVLDASIVVISRNFGGDISPGPLAPKDLNRLSYYIFTSILVEIVVARIEFSREFVHLIDLSATRCMSLKGIIILAFLNNS